MAERLHHPKPSGKKSGKRSRPPSGTPRILYITPMNLKVYPCAFCAPATFGINSFLSTTNSKLSRLSHQQIALPTRQRPVLNPSPTRKRERISKVPICAVNNNRDQDNFKMQAVDFLLKAGRFLQSPPGQIVLWAGLVWLVLTGKIGVLFDSFLVLFAVVSIVPVVAMVGFRWWINRQLVQGTCPSCGSTVTGLKGQTFPCTVCGNTVQGETTGDFSVKDPSSATIDIDAKEVDDL